MSTPVSTSVCPRCEWCYLWDGEEHYECCLEENSDGEWVCEGRGHEEFGKVIPEEEARYHDAER